MLARTSIETAPSTTATPESLTQHEASSAQEESLTAPSFNPELLKTIRASKLEPLDRSTSSYEKHIERLKAHIKEFKSFARLSIHLGEQKETYVLLTTALDHSAELSAVLEKGKLAFYQPAVDTLKNSSRQDAVVLAVRQLSNCGLSEVIDVLCETGLSHQDERVQLESARALKGRTSPDVIAALRIAGQETNNLLLREACADAIAQVSDEALTHSLCRDLLSSEEKARAFAASALCNSKEKFAIEIMCSVGLKDSSEMVRRAVVVAIAKSENPETLQKLAAASYEFPMGKDREALLAPLAGRTEPWALKALLANMDDPEILTHSVSRRNSQQLYLRSLSNISDKVELVNAAKHIFEKVTLNSDSQTLVQVINILKQRATTTTLIAICELGFNHKSFDVSEAAIDAVRLANFTGVNEYLVQNGITHQSNSYRMAAVQALTGQRDHKTLSAICNNCLDGSVHLRNVAIAALEYAEKPETLAHLKSIANPPATSLGFWSRFKPQDSKPSQAQEAAQLVLDSIAGTSRI